MVVEGCKEVGRFPALVLVFLMVLSGLVPSSSMAAQITCVQRPSERDKCEAVLIQGEIVRGDFERFVDLLDPMALEARETA